MKVFVSYSRHDEAAVRLLVDDLERARVQVWMDEELGGGDAWWTAILERIRGCEVFLFALSDKSLYSKPCRAELDYAQALHLPILPVQVCRLSTYRTDPIFTRQLVDYRESTRDSGIALVAALHEQAADRAELPNPLPEPPAIPYEYLLRLGAAIRGSADLAVAAQASMVFELRTALEDEQDPNIHDDIRDLLRTMRARRDITYAIGQDITAILGASPEEIEPGKRGSLSAEPGQRRASALELDQGAGRSRADRTSRETLVQRSGSPTNTVPSSAALAAFRRLSPRSRIIVATAAVVVVAAVAVAVIVAVGQGAPQPVPPTPASETAQPASSRPVELPFPLLPHVWGVAVDSAGSVYIADVARDQVLKLTAGAATATALPFTDLSSPEGVTVDSAGTVYVADSAHNRVVKLPAEGASQSVLPFTGLKLPSDVAVDSVGNVYVTDGDGLVKKLSASAGESVLPYPVPTSPGNLGGVAVDSAGSLYVADAAHNLVFQLPTEGRPPRQLPFTGLNKPAGVAVDASGTVYVADQGNNRVLKLPPGAPAATTLPLTGLNKPVGVAVDNRGNVYVTHLDLSIPWSQKPGGPESQWWEPVPDTPEGPVPWPGWPDVPALPDVPPAPEAVQGVVTKLPAQ